MHMEAYFTNEIIGFAVAIWKLYYCSRKGKKKKKPFRIDILPQVNKGPDWCGGRVRWGVFRSSETFWGKVFRCENQL